MIIYHDGLLRKLSGCSVNQKGEPSQVAYVKIHREQRLLFFFLHVCYSPFSLMLNGSLEDEQCILKVKKLLNELNTTRELTSMDHHKTAFQVFNKMSERREKRVEGTYCFIHIFLL